MSDKIAEIKDRHKIADLLRGGPSVLCPQIHDDRGVLLGEVERLRHERRQLRARLVECLPWVGHIPLPNTHLFSEMILARELAEDTLKEVKP